MYPKCNSVETSSSQPDVIQRQVDILPVDVLERDRTQQIQRSDISTETSSSQPDVIQRQVDVSPVDILEGDRIQQTQRSDISTETPASPQSDRSEERL